MAIKHVIYSDLANQEAINYDIYTYFLNQEGINYDIYTYFLNQEAINNDIYTYLANQEGINNNIYCKFLQKVVFVIKFCNQKKSIVWGLKKKFQNVVQNILWKNKKVGSVS